MCIYDSTCLRDGETLKPMINSTDANLRALFMPALDWVGFSRRKYEMSHFPEQLAVVSVKINNAAEPDEPDIQTGAVNTCKSALAAPSQRESGEGQEACSAILHG